MDAAILIFQILILGTLAVGGFFVLGLQSYMKKKGENQATKEDIKRLTEEVEEVRRRSHIHNVQFEKEFEVLSNLWEEMEKFYRATRALQPIYWKDSVDADARNRAYGKALGDFRAKVYGARPFYPDDIYQTMVGLMRNLQRESLVVMAEQLEEMGEDVPFDAEQLAAESEKRLEEIERARDALCEQIRAHWVLPTESP